MIMIIMISSLCVVVRHSVRASVESYSIKKLEPFYEFERQVPLPDVNSALARLERHLELNEFASITDKLRTAVENYTGDGTWPTRRPDVQGRDVSVTDILLVHRVDGSLL